MWSPGSQGRCPYHPVWSPGLIIIIRCHLNSHFHCCHHSNTDPGCHLNSHFHCCHHLIKDPGCHLNSHFHCWRSESYLGMVRFRLNEPNTGPRTPSPASQRFGSGQSNPTKCRGLRIRPQSGSAPTKLMKNKVFIVATSTRCQGGRCLGCDHSKQLVFQACWTLAWEPVRAGYIYTYIYRTAYAHESEDDASAVRRRRNPRADESEPDPRMVWPRRNSH